MKRPYAQAAILGGAYDEINLALSHRMLREGQRKERIDERR